MSKDLRQRQLDLEEETVGFGLERAERMISGERSPEDIEMFGGEKDDGALLRKQSLLYTIVGIEMPKLVVAIEQKLENHGTKAARQFKILARCGSAANIAGVAIKTFFSMLFSIPYDHDDEDAEESVSIVSLAEAIAESVLHLHEKEKPDKSKKRTLGKKKSTQKNKPIPVSDKDRLWIGLALASLYLDLTRYFRKQPAHGEKDAFAVEVADEAIAKLLEDSSNLEGERIVQERGASAYMLETGLVSPVWTPMLYPPVPWETMRNGGYIGKLAGRVGLVKGRSRMSGFSRESRPEVFEAVNHLQETKFKINAFVFDAFVSLFEVLLERVKHRHSGDSGCQDKELARFKLLFDISHTTMDQCYSLEYRSLPRNLRQSMLQLFILRNEAERFLNDDFYFVHSCDFRGRVYPLSGSLNYQGGDLPRSLIEFAEGKPITDSGAERWLAIYGANCYAEKKGGIGIDKSSFDTRLTWVKDNEERILALGADIETFWDISAKLEEWWLKADKPWVFLAWAHDWAGYKANPTKHISHMPVAVDGSSNGYQHMAALLGSNRLAREVNMLPPGHSAEVPHDIYTSVTENARKDIDEQWEGNGNIADLFREYNGLKKNGKSKSAQNESELHAIKKEILALSLNDKLPRSLAKTIVMTYPYSATEYSMTKNLTKSLRKQAREQTNPPLFHTWSEYDLNPESAYYTTEMQKANSGDSKLNNIIPRWLVETIRDAIDKSFPEAIQLLNWFKDTGRAASSGNMVIQWTSPCGFVVQQSYDEKKSHHVHVLGKRFTCKTGTGKPNNDKHASGLAPNFIHSCDAAHMMRTVNAACKAGIGSFRMIHDSYATHAADVEKLNRILRGEFVRMYSGADWLGELRESLLKHAANDIAIEPHPQVGDFDLMQVEKADYFFA